MVYRDYWALAQWYSHYGGLLGFENLFVISHGADQRIADICPRASIITVPRDDLNYFDRVRAGLMNKLQASLLNIYDWAIRVDTDELICLDPDKFEGFPELFGSCKKAAVFGLAFELVEVASDAPLAAQQSVFSNRKNAIFTGKYSKAFAVCDETELFLHGVRLQEGQETSYPFQVPEGVYLAHLKFSNTEALRVSNEHRKDLGGRELHRGPAQMWYEADETAAEVFSNIENFPHADWSDASHRAHSVVSKRPKWNPRGGIFRARPVTFEERTTLPTWFKDIYG